MWAVLLFSCTKEPFKLTSAETSRTLPLPAQGYQLVTPDYEVPSYSEVEICTVMRLEPQGDEQLYWVNRLESLVTEGTHHMNVLIGEFSFFDAFMGEGTSENALGAEVGQYLCSDLETMELAYPIFPSQRDNQKITLPEGVAAPLTAPMLMIFSHHYVNATDSPITINATLNIETINPEDVTDVAGLIFTDIGDLEVPPGTERVASRTCIFNRDVEIALVSSHSHEWGQCATMNNYDGASSTVDDDPFFVNKLWDQPPILHFEPGSFRIAEGDGVHWACHYRNPLEYSLMNNGTADGEMCVFAAVTYPSTWTVNEVEEAVASDDLSALLSLLNEVMGPCDTTFDTVSSPWPIDDGGSCSDLIQTESNTLE
jgi:hypothetical protein